MLRRLRKAGVKLGIGTDLVTRLVPVYAGSLSPRDAAIPGGGVHAAEVLAIATRQNAELLDMSDKLGTPDGWQARGRLDRERPARRYVGRITKVDVVIPEWNRLSKTDA